MSDPTPESFAFSKLTMGIHSIEQVIEGTKNTPQWVTTSLTENGSKIFGVLNSSLLCQNDLWVGRIHPNDIDAVLASLQEATESTERVMFYRFRDSKERYRWIEYRFFQNGCKFDRWVHL